jgi:hypothetical protein
MGGLAEVSRLLDSGCARGVGHRRDLHPTVAVDREVDGNADEATPVCRAFGDHAATILPRDPTGKPLNGLTEEEHRVLEAQITFVGEGAQQVVGRGE